MQIRAVSIGIIATVAFVLVLCAGCERRPESPPAPVPPAALDRTETTRAPTTAPATAPWQPAPPPAPPATHPAQTAPVAAEPADLRALQAAPLQLAVRGQVYRLEAELWRDFMPGTVPGGGPLNAVIRIRRADGGPVGPELRPERLWAIQGEEIWKADLSGEQPPAEPDAVVRMARGGPKWEPGTAADVVVSITLDGSPHLLRAENQPIRRTD